MMRFHSLNSPFIALCFLFHQGVKSECLPVRHSCCQEPPFPEPLPTWLTVIPHTVNQNKLFHPQIASCQTYQYNY